MTELSSDQICLYESMIYNMKDLNIFEIQTSCVLQYENKACSFFSSSVYTRLRNQILQHLFNYSQKFQDAITIFPSNNLKITTFFFSDYIRISVIKLFPNIVHNVTKKNNVTKNIKQPTIKEDIRTSKKQRQD